MLIVYAVNIHQGGGATLLRSLLHALDEAGTDAAVFVDERMDVSGYASLKKSIVKIRPSLRCRLQAEQALLEHASSGDVVLCLGNLPPRFELPARVVLYLQNRYLLGNTGLSGFSVRSRWRIRIERLWLKRFIGHADLVLVQTPSMQTLLQRNFASPPQVRIAPFVHRPSRYGRSIPEPARDEGGKRYDFIYVASGEPHKNHRNLIDAWCVLAGQGLFPSLCLTLERDHALELADWIQDRIARYKLKVAMENLQSPAHVEEMLGMSRAVIYPSRFESFGLPLIEARQAGLPVLAGELDYVRDVLDPEESFDPESPVSISRAVKRFLGAEEQPLELLSAKEFIEQITND